MALMNSATPTATEIKNAVTFVTAGISDYTKSRMTDPAYRAAVRWDAITEVAETLGVAIEAVGEHRGPNAFEDGPTVEWAYPADFVALFDVFFNGMTA